MELKYPEDSRFTGNSSEFFHVPPIRKFIGYFAPSQELPLLLQWGCRRSGSSLEGDEYGVHALQFRSRLYLRVRSSRMTIRSNLLLSIYFQFLFHHSNSSVPFLDFALQIQFALVTLDLCLPSLRLDRGRKPQCSLQGLQHP